MTFPFLPSCWFQSFAVHFFSMTLNLLQKWPERLALQRSPCFVNKSKRGLGFPILYKHGTWASPVLRLLEKTPIRKTVRSKPVTRWLQQGLKIAPERMKVVRRSLIRPRGRNAKFELLVGFSMVITTRLMLEHEEVEVGLKSLNYRR